MERIVKVQESLLRKAIKLVSSGSTIVYSTCSILKEENEEILRKMEDFVEILPIEKPKSEGLVFLESSENTLTVCPNKYYEGFFIAKLLKK